MPCSTKVAWPESRVEFGRCGLIPLLNAGWLAGGESGYHFLRQRPKAHSASKAQAPPTVSINTSHGEP